MTTEELLKPRYKVIADYPDSHFNIGSIYRDGDALPPPGVRRLSDYPHLFKPLAWWEERKAEDMPQHIKRIRLQGNSNPLIKIGDIIKVKWVNDYFDKINYPTVRMIAFFTEAEDGTSDLNYDENCFEPATEVEYLNQKQRIIEGL